MNRKLVEGSRLAVWVTGAILVAAAITISGCGGGDTSTSPTAVSARSITKAELIAKGDAICAETDKIQERRIAAYGKREPKYTQTKRAFVRMIGAAALPPVQVEIEELDALGAPEGEEAKVALIISGYESAQRSAEADPALVFGFTEGPFVEPAKLASRYGFRACAKPL